jgi:hypothetical protein
MIRKRMRGRARQFLATFHFGDRKLGKGARLNPQHSPCTKADKADKADSLSPKPGMCNDGNGNEGVGGSRIFIFNIPVMWGILDNFL